MFELPTGNLRQTYGKSVGFLAPMGFHIPDDNVATRGEFAMCGLEHGEGLTHTRAHAEKHFQLTAFLPRSLSLNCRQDRVGVRTVVCGHSRMATDSKLHW